MMSEVNTTEKPTEAKAQEPAFNVDKLNQCTARFTRRAWNLFLDYRTSEDAIKNKLIRAKITANGTNGAEELLKLLVETGNIGEVVKHDATFEVTTTFWTIQKIVKEAPFVQLDAVKAG